MKNIFNKGIHCITYIITAMVTLGLILFACKEYLTGTDYPIVMTAATAINSVISVVLFSHIKRVNFFTAVCDLMAPVAALLTFRVFMYQPDVFIFEMWIWAIVCALLVILHAIRFNTDDTDDCCDDTISGLPPEKQQDSSPEGSAAAKDSRLVMFCKLLFNMKAMLFVLMYFYNAAVLFRCA